ncbi:hypothetical protein [Nocardia flavorosea]|uniref:Uncharacterized protein n=1 Tax=Nocardia flavorosea TaxID=53429 RepID=A0A846YDS5_9NOCA|nr:hypothetical protein [Nocardia flavorosea]NKY54949.1 hypothetical protein [Nocardia flavorosea]
MTETSGPTLRPSPLDRLLRLDPNSELPLDTVRSAAQQLGITEETLRQWLDARRSPSAPVASKPPEPGTRQMGYRDAGRRVRATVSVTAGDHLLSRIPDSDVATFRADAYRRLAPSEFARVDAVYTAGLGATCRWIAARTGLPCHHDLDRRSRPVWFGRDEVARAEYMRTILRPRPAPRHFLPGGPSVGRNDEWLDILGLYRFLGGFVAGSPGRGHTIVRLRGAQAAFLLHGMRLDLPPDLNYSVGSGLTTVRFDRGTAEQIRARAGNPVDAAALATVLFTGATMVELAAVPQLALNHDSLIFTGPIGYSRAADVYVWVIPPAAQDLLHDLQIYYDSRADSGSKLFTGAIGSGGRRLRGTANRCGVAIPQLHHWNHSWIRRAGLLRGIESPEYVRNSDLLFGLRLIPSPGPVREG